MVVRPKRRKVAVVLAAVIVLIWIGFTGGGDGDDDGDADAGTGSGVLPGGETSDGGAASSLTEPNAPAIAKTKAQLDSRDESAAETQSVSGSSSPPHGVDRSTVGKSTASDSTAGTKEEERSASGASPLTAVAGKQLAEQAKELPGELPAEDLAVAYEDLVASCIQIVHRACADGEWERGAKALREAEAWPLDPARRERLIAARAHWRAKLKTCFAEITAQIVAGRVGLVEPRVRGLASAEDKRLCDVVQSILQAQAWPAWRQSIVAGDRPTLGAALERGRAVRVMHSGKWSKVRVVDERRGEVTVRIRTERGDLYPVYSRARVEPLEATTTELLDQAAAAIRAGDALLAALWLGSAKARADVDPKRYASLLRYLTAD